MSHTTPILKQISNFMESEKIKLRTLADLSEVNVGTLSAVLSHQKILTADHLDRITSVMKLPVGHLYQQYIDEFLRVKNPNWRRIRPFLYRCAVNNKLECIQEVVDLLLDNLMYASALFELAEELYHDGLNGAENLHDAATILFENVAASERHQYSERLAFCHYRLFLIRRGSDQEQNLKNAIQFEPYVDRLDEFDQLEALRQLLNVYKSLQNWDLVYTTAKRLHSLATIVYSNIHNSKKERRRVPAPKQLERPLFYYVTQSKLWIGGVHYEWEQYDITLKHMEELADLSWIKETDEQTLHWIGLYEQLIKANILLSKVMAGKVSFIEEYIEYCESMEEQIYSALWNVTKAANKHNLNIDPYLIKYKNQIDSFKKEEYRDTFLNGVNNNFKRLGLMYELAKYYLSRRNYSKGFRELVDGLGESAIINEKGSFLEFIRLFERYRNYAKPEYQEEYRQLMNTGG